MDACDQEVIRAVVTRLGFLYKSHLGSYQKRAFGAPNLQTRPNPLNPWEDLKWW